MSQINYKLEYFVPVLPQTVLLWNQRTEITIPKRLLTFIDKKKQTANFGPIILQGPHQVA